MMKYNLSIQNLRGTKTREVSEKMRFWSGLKAQLVHGCRQHNVMDVQELDLKRLI